MIPKLASALLLVVTLGGAALAVGQELPEGAPTRSGVMQPFDPPALAPAAAVPTLLPAALTPAELATRFPLGDPARSRQFYERGQQLRRARSAEALELFQAAVRLSPIHAWARYGLACELARAGRSDAAATELEQLYLQATAGPPRAREPGKPRTPAAHDAARALLRVEAEPDLAPLRAAVRLQAMIDAVAARETLELADLDAPGCPGWSREQGLVLCTWSCRIPPLPADHGVLLSRGLPEVTELALPRVFDTGEETAAAIRQRAAARLAELRIPPRALPVSVLSPGRPIVLNPGYQVHWRKPEQGAQTVQVTGPHGQTLLTLDGTTLRGCPRALTFDAPEALRAYLVRPLDLVVLYANFRGSSTGEPERRNDTWSAVAFVRPGR